MVIQRVCEAVFTRAARLAAAGIVAIVKKIDMTDGCTVAVECSLHPQFLERYITVHGCISGGEWWGRAFTVWL